MERKRSFRFPIPDSRFPIPDSRFPIPDTSAAANGRTATNGDSVGISLIRISTGLRINEVVNNLAKVEIESQYRLGSTVGAKSSVALEPPSRLAAGPCVRWFPPRRKSP